MAAEAPHPDHAGRRAALFRLFGAAVVLGVVLVTVTATGSIPSPDDARDWGEGLGPAAPFLSVPLFVVANFVVPWAILTGACGLLFGTAGGTFAALAGVTGAAMAQMAVARLLARGHHGNLLPQRARGIEDFLERNGTIAVMESRIVPLLPFAAVNYTAGVTRLRFRQVGLGTVVGASPKIFAYAALGGSLSNLGAPEAKVAIALLVVLGIAGALLVRRQIQTERVRAAEGPAPSA